MRPTRFEQLEEKYRRQIEDGVLAPPPERSDKAMLIEDLLRQEGDLGAIKAKLGQLLAPRPGRGASRSEGVM